MIFSGNFIVTWMKFKFLTRQHISLKQVRRRIASVEKRN